MNFPDMNLIADTLLAFGALGAAAYCIILAKRLKKFNNLQHGVGGAVAVLSAQVDDMTKTLQKAQRAAATSSATLTSLTERAEDVAKRLELMLASMHDLPSEAQGGGAPKATAPKDAPATESEEREQPVADQQDASNETTAAPVFLSKRTATLEAAE
jgi:hypothetical protein